MHSSRAAYNKGRANHDGGQVRRSGSKMGGHPSTTLERRRQGSGRGARRELVGRFRASLFLCTLLVGLVISVLFGFAQLQSQSHQLQAEPGAPEQPQQQQQQAQPQAQQSKSQQSASSPDNDPFAPTVLPPVQFRPRASVHLREWARKLSHEIHAVSNKTNCVSKIERIFDKRAQMQTINMTRLREHITDQINILVAQHAMAVNAIVAEAERLVMAHNFNKSLRFNYVDVHRLRNELDGPSPQQQQLQLQQQAPDAGQQTGGQPADGSAGAASLPAAGLQTPQFTSIGGGTPVPGPPEWQTPFRSVMMQLNKNFGDIPVNTSMSAVHLPLPIYVGQPEIMNGIAWTDRLDMVFKRNLATYVHVHHQYYGDHLGFLRTFPAHKWRIPRTDPDLFDARARPWYVAGTSAPKNMVILVDTSGSMTGLRREIARGVVFEILETLTSNDYFAVMRFAETVVPVGLPKCNLRAPRLSPAMDEACNGRGLERDPRDRFECEAFRSQWESRLKYLRDHPQVIPGKNGSYLSDENYRRSINNVTREIRDAYMVPGTSRNIRYLRSNFTMPTAGIANFTNALMAAFELLQAYNRTTDLGAQCNQVIMLITDGATEAHEEIFNRYNYPGAPVRMFTYVIGREVGDIKPTKAMACKNRGYYTHVINLGEAREQVQKYLPVLARPMVLGHHHPVSWTNAYGDETFQVLTDWVLEVKRRERARIMLNEERDRMSDFNSSDVINIELTNIAEYDDIPLVDEELKNRIICEDTSDDQSAMEQSLQEELDPLGYNDLACHWSTRKADLMTSVVKPVFDNRNTTLFFERVLSKNIWTEHETHVRNAQLLGVAGVDLRLSDMMRLAPSHLLGANGYLILVGQNGFVMHHPDLRALLEDPFDKQSKILKPQFNAIDLHHLEQPQTAANKSQSSSAASEPKKSADAEAKVLKMREACMRHQSGSNYFHAKRAIDCRRRAQIRNINYNFGPIKDTPFSLILAYPHVYGSNRAIAKLELREFDLAWLKPSDYDLWTVHPEYRYCDVGAHSAGAPGEPSAGEGGSLASILRVLELSASRAPPQIHFEDLSLLNAFTPPVAGDRRQTSAKSAPERIVCDKELLPSLLFDAMATHEPADSFCGLLQPEGGGCGQRARSAFAAFYSSDEPVFEELREEPCAHSGQEMRAKLTQSFGLEMSFVATRSGLTRVRVFDLSARIKKLADLFIQRHNKAVDESWYSRTVDYNLRFSEDHRVITVPFNAYIRLIAKLRQRITQRHPAVNDTRANCDPQLSSEAGSPGADSDAPEAEAAGANATTSQPEAGSSSQRPSETSPSALPASVSKEASVVVVSSDQTDALNNGGHSSGSTSAETAAGGSSQPQQGATLNDEPSAQQAAPPVPPPPRINYNEYSTFDFLDLLANSSVHVSSTQTVIASGRTKSRTPVAVTGLLHDYASFARRFLNSTSLDVRIEPARDNAEAALRVELCPGGECPTRCGFRNDTIDCLLLDNNGYIVVAEELPYIGRALADYDDRLMAALVEARVYHTVQVVDYQAICARNDQPDSGPRSASLTGASSAVSPALALAQPSLLARLTTGNVVANLLASISHVWSVLGSLLLYQTFAPDLGQLMQLHLEPHARDAFGPLVDAQTAYANQSLLAILPNKTYLRPCEKLLTLYESRPIEGAKIYSNTPEYYVTRCNCSGWFVYEAVPQTNLIMLVVNTTSACRRCDAGSAPLIDPLNLAATALAAGAPASANAPHQAGSQSMDKSQSRSQSQSQSQQPPPPTRSSAEDQVCWMLEKEAQLYVKRPDICYPHHPDEANIHLCGAAPSSLAISFPLVILATLFASCMSLVRFASATGPQMHQLDS